MLAACGVAVLAVFIGGRLPTGFLPQEDQGYLFVAMQLPDAASLQRTDAAAQKVSKALLQTPGIGGVVGVDGFSLLTQTQSTNTAFFFVSLKPWDVAKVARGADPGHPGKRAAKAGWSKRGPRLLLPAAGDSWHRHFGRRHHDSAGPLGQRRSGFPHQECVRVSRRGLQAAGDRRRRALLSARRSAAVRRRGSRKGRAAAGGSRVRSTPPCRHSWAAIW